MCIYYNVFKDYLLSIYYTDEKNKSWWLPPIVSDNVNAKVSSLHMCGKIFQII